MEHHLAGCIEYRKTWGKEEAETGRKWLGAGRPCMGWGVGLRGGGGVEEVLGGGMGNGAEGKLVSLGLTVLDLVLACLNMCLGKA